MKKAIIFGAGGTGKAVYEEIRDAVEVVGFVDSDAAKEGQTVVEVLVGGGHKM